MKLLCSCVLNVCISNNHNVHTIPIFFRKGIELIISAIISLQSLIFKWTTFEISLSLTQFNVLLPCVDYSNNTCIDHSLYKHTHNFLSMVNTGYISDVIQVQSHTVWKGILMGGGKT